MFNHLLLIGGLGTGEVILIFTVVIILFGAKKIPEIARGLGKGIKEFKAASKEIKQEISKSTNEESL